MKDPRWINRCALDILHADSLSEHGGLEGVRDEGALESALARPVNLHAYEPEADCARLAAAYGFGLVRNHPFADGNKRAAFTTVGLFLGLNGMALRADKIDAYRTIMKLADGSLSEGAFAAWIRKNVVKTGKPKRAAKKSKKTRRSGRT